MANCDFNIKKKIAVVWVGNKTSAAIGKSLLVKIYFVLPDVQMLIGERDNSVFSPHSAASGEIIIKNNRSGTSAAMFCGVFSAEMALPKIKNIAS